MPTTHHPQAAQSRAWAAAGESLAALALFIAGMLFVAYPALRPWSDETTLAGAAAMSSMAWVFSHLFGMVAFVLLSVGLWRLVAGAGSAEDGTRTIRRRAAQFAAGGTALILPYYGGETFGIQAIAARAVADADASLLEVVEAFRLGPVAVALFGAGLLALAVAGVMLIRSTWQPGRLRRLGGLLAGSGLVLYLPQFFATPGLRIAHGVLLGAGLALLAVQAWRSKG